MAAAYPQRYLVVDGTEPPAQIHEAVCARLRTLGVQLP